MIHTRVSSLGPETRVSLDASGIEWELGRMQEALKDRPFQLAQIGALLMSSGAFEIGLGRAYTLTDGTQQIDISLRLSQGVRNAVYRLIADARNPFIAEQFSRTKDKGAP